MNIDEARHLYRKCFRSASQLTELIDFINASNFDEKEGKALKMILAGLIADIGLKFGSEILKEFPTIQEEIDTELEEYGKLVE